MINFTQDVTQPDLFGYLYAVLFCVTDLVKSLLYQQYFNHSTTVGMRIKTAITTAVYSKVQVANVGRLINVYLIACLYISK